MNATMRTNNAVRTQVDSRVTILLGDRERTRSFARQELSSRVELG